MHPELMEWAWQQLYGGDVSKRLIILGIAFHANAIAMTETTHEQVAIWASLDADEYQKAIADLQNGGILSIIPADEGKHQFILVGYKGVSHEH